MAMISQGPLIDSAETSSSMRWPMTGSCDKVESSTASRNRSDPSSTPPSTVSATTSRGSIPRNTE